MQKEFLKIPWSLKILSFISIFIWIIFLFINYVTFASINVSEILNVSWSYVFALLLPIILAFLILFWIFKKNKRFLYIIIIILTIILFSLDSLFLITDTWFNLLNYSFLVILLAILWLFFYPKNKLLWIILFLHIIWLIVWYLNLYNFEEIFSIYTMERIISDIIFLFLVVGQFIFIKTNYEYIKNAKNEKNFLKKYLFLITWLIPFLWFFIYSLIKEWFNFFLIVGTTLLFFLFSFQLLLTSSIKNLFVYIYSIKTKEPRFITDKNQFFWIYISGGIAFLVVLSCFIFIYDSKVDLPNIDNKYFDIEGGFANLKDEENGFYHIKTLFNDVYLKKESMKKDLKSKYEKDENCLMKADDFSSVWNTCYCVELHFCFETKESRNNNKMDTFFTLISNEKRTRGNSYEHKDYEATPDQLYNIMKEKNIAFEPYFKLLDEYYPKYKAIIEKHDFQSWISNIPLPIGIKWTQENFRDLEIYAFYNCYIKNYDKCTDILSTNYKFAKKFLESKWAITTTLIWTVLLEKHVTNIIYMLDNMDIPDQYKNIIKKDFENNIDFEKVLVNTMKAEYHTMERNIPNLLEYVTEIPLKENWYLFNYKETELILKSYFKNMIENKNFEWGNDSLEILLSKKYILLSFGGVKNFQDYTKYFSNRYW